MIQYQGTLYRPPSEGNSLILQATIGCSYNKCSFCAMYREKKFRVRKIEDLVQEIKWAKENLPRVNKVFLADGDALMAKTSTLLEILRSLNETFPDLRRVSCYASPQALQVRSVEDMTLLRENGLTLYYLGVESGDDAVLESLTKGVDSSEMVRVALKAKEALVKLSTMILLGAGGRKRSLEHAAASARVINAIQPRFVSTLVMTPVEGTPLGDLDAEKKVDRLSPMELTRELSVFVKGLELEGALFRSNHASNYLPMGGSLPKDKALLVSALDDVLKQDDDSSFVPDVYRGL